jgi:Cu/Ag efflux protein CusF
MTKQFVTSVAVGAGMLVFAAAGQSQTAPSLPGKAEAPAARESKATKRAIGEVTSVDAKSGKLAVKTSTEELTLDVQGSAAKNALSDIKVGDRVTVSYQDKGGMLVANSINKASGSWKTGMESSGRSDKGSPSSVVR